MLGFQHKLIAKPLAAREEWVIVTATLPNLGDADDPVCAVLRRNKAHGIVSYEPNTTTVPLRTVYRVKCDKPRAGILRVAVCAAAKLNGYSSSLGRSPIRKWGANDADSEIELDVRCGNSHAKKVKEVHF